MALIAVLAVVDIPAYALVLLVSLCLQVAVRAAEHRIVIRVGVAITANAIGVAMVHREPGVIELGVSPDLRVMTGVTGGREMSRHVIRIVGVQVILLVAAVAVRRQARPVVVDVAVRAGTRRHHVRIGQREARLAVVELAIGQGNGVMTELASLRPAHLRMGRIVGIVVILQVTGHAGGLVQLVIVVDVAVGTGPWRHGVHAG